ncbi:jg9555, partial [Pararge aegeria aegeria]
RFLPTEREAMTVPRKGEAAQILKQRAVIIVASGEEDAAYLFSINPPLSPPVTGRLVAFSFSSIFAWLFKTTTRRYSKINCVPLSVRCSRRSLKQLPLTTFPALLNVPLGIQRKSKKLTDCRNPFYTKTL